MDNTNIAKELEELKNRVAVLEELNELRQRIDQLQKDLSTQYKIYPSIWPNVIRYGSPWPEPYYNIWCATEMDGTTSTTYTGDTLLNGKK